MPVSTSTPTTAVVIISPILKYYIEKFKAAHPNVSSEDVNKNLFPTLSAYENFKKHFANDNEKTEVVTNNTNNLTLNEKVDIIQTTKVPDVEYSDILYRAKDFLPSTDSYNKFKEIVDKEHSTGNLDKAAYMANVFDILKLYKNSPLYADQLNRFSKDPLFSDFASVLLELSSPLSSTPTLTGTKEFNSALTEELTSTTDSPTTQTIVNTTTEEVPAVTDKPDLSSKIINPGIIEGKPEEQVVTKLEKTIENPNETQESLNPVVEEIKNAIRANHSGADTYPEHPAEVLEEIRRQMEQVQQEQQQLLPPQ